MAYKPGDPVLVTEGGKKLKARVHEWNPLWAITQVIFDDAKPGDISFVSSSSVEPYSERATQECSWHDWKEYIGFREIYKYCTVCDKKRWD